MEVDGSGGGGGGGGSDNVQQQAAQVGSLPPTPVRAGGIRVHMPHVEGMHGAMTMSPPSAVERSDADAGQQQQLLLQEPLVQSQPQPQSQPSQLDTAHAVPRGEDSTTPAAAHAHTAAGSLGHSDSAVVDGEQHATGPVTGDADGVASHRGLAFTAPGTGADVDADAAADAAVAGGVVLPEPPTSPDVEVPHLPAPWVRNKSTLEALSGHLTREFLSAIQPHWPSIQQYFKRKSRVFGSGSLTLAAVARMFVLLPLHDDGGVRVEEAAHHQARQVTSLELANHARAEQRRLALERRRSSVLSRLSTDSSGGTGLGGGRSTSGARRRSRASRPRSAASRGASGVASGTGTGAGAGAAGAGHAPGHGHAERRLSTASGVSSASGGTVPRLGGAASVATTVEEEEEEGVEEETVDGAASRNPLLHQQVGRIIRWIKEVLDRERSAKAAVVAKRQAVLRRQEEAKAAERARVAAEKEAARAKRRAAREELRDTIRQARLAGAGDSDYEDAMSWPSSSEASDAEAEVPVVVETVQQRRRRLYNEVGTRASQPRCVWLCRD